MNEKKNDDDQDVFGPSADDRMERARHLRTCPECRKLLMEQVQRYAKTALAEAETEMGRKMTGEERAIAAKILVVRESMFMAERAIEVHRAIASVLEKADNGLEQAMAAGAIRPVGDA